MAHTVEIVEGVDLGKVKINYLLAHLASQKVEVKGKTARAAVEALAKHNKRTGADGKLVLTKLSICAPPDGPTGGCGAKSDPSLDWCPVCGMGFAADGKTPATDPAVAQTDPASDEKKKGEKKPKANGASNGAPHAAPAPEPPKEEDDDKAPPASDDEEAKMEAAPATTDTKKGGAKATKKDAKAEKAAAAQAAKAAEAEKAAKAAETTALAIRESNTKLDGVVKHVKSLMAEGARTYIAVGVALAEAHKAEVWKLRSGDDGKPAYKSFDQLCETEFGIARDKAYNMMAASKRFTEEQIARLGESKVEQLLKAPEKAQPKIIEKIEAGATYREVREFVAEARSKAGGGARNEGGRTIAATKAAMESAKKRAEAAASRITIATTAGTKTVKLFCKENEERAAKKLGDAPVGTMEMENGVIQTFSIEAGADGQLLLKIKTKREKK